MKELSEQDTRRMAKLIATWSGGKDGCLACWAVMQRGHEIRYLLNTVSDDHLRVRFHGTTDKLIRDQAEAIGIPLVQRPTVGERYEEQFKDAARSALEDDIGGIVFGDIHLQHCIEWAQKVCVELGVRAVEPLWGREPQDVIEEFAETGFEAVVVSAQGELLGAEWIGRTIDRDFIDEIRALGNIDPCGENGEFHTVVLDGPLFQKRIEITDSERVFIGGYWFLDIRDYRITPKSE